jgi:hypothetical protein
MKSTVVAAALAGAVLVSLLSALGAQDLSLLTPGQQRAFHACVYRAWVNDYCRYHSFGFIWDWNTSYRTCVIANGGRQEDILTGYTQSGDSTGIRDNCWHAAQSIRR